MRPEVALLLGAWVAGISIGVITGTAAAASMGLIGCLLIAWWHRPRAAAAVAAAMVLLLGFVYGQAVRPAELAGRPADELTCPASDTLAGLVLERPDIRERTVRYLVADERGCRFFVYAQRWPVYERGTRVTVTGGRYADQATVLAERAEFGRYVALHDVAGVWSYPAVQAEAGSNSDARYRAAVARTHRVFREPTGSLVGAMLFADRGQFPADTAEDFRRTSLTHVLSISGMHISLLTGMIFAAVGLLSLPPAIRTAVVIMLLWSYVWFVGSPISAVRAGFFWSVTLVALRLGLLVSLPTAILLTLSIMLTWQPLMVANIGLQLSFMAVVGIGLGLFMSKPWRQRVRRPWQAIASATIVSLGATLFTWPLISYYFGIVSLFAVAANLLIVPVVPVIMGGSVLAIAASYISLLLGYIVALPVHAATAWMIAVAHTLGSWPGSWVAFTVPSWLLGLYYSSLLITLVMAVRWQGRSWREIWE